MEGYAYPRHYSPKNRQWPTRRLTKSPAWCAVDLRDGNQALPKPMDPYQKESYFKLLTDVGFKEIEIGFPAAAVISFQEIGAFSLLKESADLVPGIAHKVEQVEYGFVLLIGDKVNGRV